SGRRSRPAVPASALLACLAYHNMVPAPGPLLDRHLCGPAGGIDGAVRQEPPPGGCRWPGATPHRRLSGTRRGSPHQCASAVPPPRVILAFDADEILAANALDTSS